MTTSNFNKLRWISFGLAVVLPFIAWGEFYHWRLTSLTAYQFFPLFGMWALLVMATHFILAGLRTRHKNIESNQAYSDATGTFVLFCLLVHPTLLAWQLWRSGLGIPPKSFYEFVGSSAVLYIALGSSALFAFLVYELLQSLREKPKVKKYWIYIFASQVVAIMAIYIHAYGVGMITRTGWFSIIWVLTGIAAIVGGILAIQDERKKQPKAQQSETK